jgi:hypothetical protein
MNSESFIERPYNAAKRVSLLQKLFIWSIITEPLLFFILLPSTAIGLPITLSRVFQAAFLILYVLNIFSKRKGIPIINPLKTYNFHLICYCVLIFISSAIGWQFGSYSIDPSNVSNYSEVDTHISFSGGYLRLAFEGFILIYYFVYFVILPRFFICSKMQLSYLFKWMVRVFYFVIIMGLIDFLANVLGFDLIPRHLVDSGWVQVGRRFHSIVGEPRDAFVYLLFGLSILYLMAGLNLKKPPRRIVVVLILFCAMLTQSFSGVIGLILGLGLFVVFTKPNVKNYTALFSLLCISLLALYLSFDNSVRIQGYVNMIITLPEVMLLGNPLPYLIVVQSPDVVPFWLFLQKLIEFDFYSILFGSGIGSASYATNNFMEAVTFQINNPRAQITRLLFESGVIGLYIYLIILIKPVQRLRPIVKKNCWVGLWYSSLLLFGGMLGHRSNLGIIFAGIALAIIINRLYEPKSHHD